MDEKIETPPAVPLSYESRSEEKRRAGGPLAVIVMGFLLVLLGSGGEVLAVALAEHQSRSEAMVGVAAASTLVLLVGLYLIVIAAQKLLR